MTVLPRISEWWKARPPGHILALAALFAVLASYPGYFTIEGLDEWGDARFGAVSDWNSPAFSRLLRVTSFVSAGPALVLAIQVVLLLLGAFELYRRTEPPRRAALLAAILVLAPPVFVGIAVIGRDSMLVASLLAGYALLGARHPGSMAAGAILLVFGAAQREAALIAVVPLVLGALVPHLTGSRVRRGGIALGAAVGISLVAIGVDHLCVENRTLRTEALAAVYDIAGTLQDLTEDQIASEIAAQHIETVAPPQARSLRSVVRDPGRAGLVFGVDTLAQREALIAARDEIVALHRGAYIAHRMRHARGLLGLRASRDLQPVYTRFTVLPPTQDPMRHRASHSPLQAGVIFLLELLNYARVYTPAIYLVLALGLLVVMVRRRAWPLVALLASGLLHEIGLVFTTTNVDYRQSLWLVVVAVFALASVSARRIASSRVS